ncbi:membrane protein [Streptomyces vietnamensis]|uniref:Membrane protein n=1 Tax=Streptomyces vietnamensis TaxID=362257 RepID=A0A0B5ING4_9ACTN|nr:membrane protein [Streptomyces vietnamensis]
MTGRSGRAPGRARVERAGAAAAPGAPAGRPSGRPAGRRPVPPVVLALRRLPSPRLTGLGAGLFASAVMLALGLLDQLLLDGSPVVYGLLFLPVSALTALWVRTADLVTAPIGVPIAFAVGVVPVAGGTGGFGGQAMAVVTALAVHAGWLYGGTLVAGLIASVRKVRDMGRRHQRTAPRPGAGEGSGGRAPAAGRRPVV